MQGEQFLAESSFRFGPCTDRTDSRCQDIILGYILGTYLGISYVESVKSQKMSHDCPKFSSPIPHIEVSSFRGTASNSAMKTMMICEFIFKLFCTRNLFIDRKKGSGSRRYCAL